MERLLAELESAYDQAVFEELKTVLSVHTKIEEELFYPAVGDATASSKRLVDSAEYDHRALHNWIDDLDPTLPEEVADFRRAIGEHIANEERDIFREAERGLDEVDLDNLGREMIARLEELAPRGRDGRRHEKSEGERTPAG